MKKLALILVALILGAAWLLLHTEYDFTTHVVQGCEQPITVVEYSRPFSGRGVAFVLGNYSTSEIPQDCLNFARGSGFDEPAFEAIITCENGTVVVYHDEPPLLPRSVPGLKAQVPDDEANWKIRAIEATNPKERAVITLY